MDQFIRFDQVTLSSLEQDLVRELAATQQVIANLEQATVSSWQQIMEPLLAQLYRLHQTWGIVGHLQSVQDSPQLRQLHDKFLPQITDLQVNLGQNHALYLHVVAIKTHEYVSLTQEQQKIIDNELRDFKLSGISLAKPEQEQFKHIQTQLSELKTKFEHNVLDATDNYSKFVTKEELIGVPEDSLELYRAQAVASGSDGYKITLHLPSYLPIMQYADKRSLREELYLAYVTRASDLSAVKTFDNQPVIQQILCLRQAKASLLGFANYAELSLATKMAESPTEVLTFLTDLAAKARPYALEELAELQQFAKQQDGIEQLQAWDIAYYSEKLQQHKYSYSSNELKQYFPLPKVLSGLFALIYQLYQVELVANPAMPVWQASVSGYDVRQAGKLIGHIYFDLYAREGKQPGAWMNSAQDRNANEAELRLPIAYVICNFSQPLADKASLLTFDEVQTLFHEMGHALHHLLTEINHAALAGINGVEWDAVELPSQFMEYFAWDYELLLTLTAHTETGEVLPRALFERVLAARYFQAGLHMLRQLEYAIFDLKLHSQFDPNADDYLVLLNQVRAQTAVIIPPTYNRFANSFAHIFAGGYAAGYYSYKWAEVLACDVFSRFDGQHGQQLMELGEQLRATVLSRGGLSPMLDNFKQFMGREPQIAALLKYSGLTV